MVKKQKRRMAKINGIKSLSSGIHTEFSSVSSIEIEDKPFASGGFGEVYHCKNVNGKKTTVSQVIKIFIDVNGSAKKGYDTIQKLQKEIKVEATELKIKSKQFDDEYVGLLGCPQFSFEGELNGKKVFGYSANNLKTLGFEEFKDILQDPLLLKKYQKIPLQDKLLIAYHIVRSFDFLYSVQYIHADFKSEALFVNLSKKQCAIIDFDSGSVMQSVNDKPTTWGTPQDWLAPEIFEQFATGLNNRGNAKDPIPVKVDLLSDMWSVAVCIHYLIFTFHPFFYFSEISQRSLKKYTLENYKFPNIDKRFPFLTKNQQLLNLHNGFYTNYFHSQLPQELKDKFIQTFTKGCLNSSARTSYGQWKSVLKITQSPPIINYFKVDRTQVIDKNPIIAEWSVDNASILLLNNKDVSGNKKISLPIRQDTELTLTAKNPFGDVSKKIKLSVSKDKPTIVYFRSDVPNNFIQSKDKIKLSWDVTGFEKIEIIGIGDVSNRKSISVNPPKKDTVIVLQATSYFGQVSTQKISFTVNKKPPIIQFFQSSTNTVFDKNKPAELSWSIFNAALIEIDNGIGDVTNKKSVRVIPARDTTYTIRATSFFGAVSTKQTKLLVSKVPPTINAFNVSKKIVNKIEDIVLSWDVTGAERVFINQQIGDVSSLNSVNYKVTRDVVLTLFAESYFGVLAQQSISIQTSKIPPTIKNFQASKHIVNDNKPIELKWDVDNAVSIIIDNGVGDVSNTNRKSVVILNDTTLTLKAVSCFGAISTRSIKVQISKTPPKVISFRAQAPLLAEGLSTHLDWNVEGAFSVEIDNGIGKVGASGKVSISPTTDTTYTLVAKNYFGYESRSHVYLKILRKPQLNHGSVQLKMLPKLKKHIK